MSQPVIDAQSLVKTYGKGDSLFTALDGVSLAVQQGESVAIVGKSGSGKSTLMHILALLDKPDTGTLSIGGKESTELDTKALNELRNQEFGFVFQQFFLTPNETVLENVTLPLRIAGVSKAERTKRGLDALEQLEMKSKANNKATDLSGGQKQRVVIARALINNPRIIFADEPTGNLDTKTSDVVEDILFGLKQEHNITVVVVTHDPDLAQKCDRQIHLQDGKVVNA
ncbi:MAG: ABC transporter ATP-binding protein [Micrococcaceae bacterium]